MIELLATLIEQYEIRLGYNTPVLSPRDRLVGLIEARELSQSEVARSQGVSRTTLNELLSGKRGISKINAARLASFFQVPVDQFIAAN